VRRLSVASLDSGAESPVYGAEPSASADRNPRAKPPWAGGGGRWVVWPMRAVLWAAILIIGYRGVTAILLNETPSAGSSTGNDSTGTAASGFPVALGEAFAMRFGQVYLNYSPSTAAQRAQQLAAFIPASARAKDPQFGWNGSGTSVNQSTEVAGVDVRSADTAVVTLLSTVNGQLMELGVPLYASGGGLVVSAEPAWLPAPPVAALPSAQQASSDQAAKGALTSQLPGFFQAFASGDQVALARYLAPGASISGLGGAVGFGGITSLEVPQGEATRDITVTVDWTLPAQAGTGAPRLVTTYDMSVIDQQSGRWYVKDIRASTQPMGTQ
jgi:Conjugative transposon protein TcpC